MSRKIYSAFFMPNNKHVIWEFAPGSCRLPEGVEQGDTVIIRSIGKYADNDVSCTVVSVELLSGEILSTQESGTLLHFTTMVSHGVPAKESGVRATKFGYNDSCSEVYLATAGYFVGGRSG